MADQTAAFETRLRQAREEDDTLAHEQIDGVQVTGADLSGLSWQDVTLVRCRFVACDFTKTGWFDCHLSHCAFVDCTFDASRWRRVTVDACKGEGCRFCQSQWQECTLSDSILRYTNFAAGVWKQMTLSGCHFREACLAGMKVSRLLLREVDFTGVDFFKTPLKDVDLTACTLEGIVVSDTCAELRGAKMNVLQAVDTARLLGITVV